MSSCGDLSSAEHAVLTAILSKKNRRGNSQIDRSRIADMTGIEAHEIGDHVLGLIDTGFVSGNDEGSYRVLGACTCTCNATLNRLGVAPVARSSELVAFSSGVLSPPTGDKNPSLGRTPAAPAARTTVNRIVRRTYRGSHWKDKPVAVWNSNDLAGYFSEQVMLHWSGKGPGMTNFKALSGNFARWRREHEIGPIVIKAMIDRFLLDENAMSFGDSAWKTFVGQRQRFYNEALRRLREQERETSVGDSNYWIGDEETPEETTIIDWTGANS